MDPLAHTLAGASLAQTGLKRLTPLATTALLVGANLPDIDAVTYLLDDDLSLAVRRGWTHGVLSMAVWPCLLAGVLLALDRIVGRRVRGRVPARFGPLLLISAIAVLSHPALDWLNAYGIRLLMPLDGRWFYGDTLFIVDPWLWLLCGAGAALGSSRGVVAAGAWLGLAAATTGLVLLSPAVPAWGRVAWVVAVSVTVVVRLAAREARLARRAARIAVGLAICYIAMMRLGTLSAGRQAAGWLASAGIDPIEIAALPVPANPFVRDVIARDADRYHFVGVGWIDGRARFSAPPAPDVAPTPVIEAALASPSVRGLRTWMRYPTYDVRTSGDGYRVFITDVRFWRPGAPRSEGFGRAVVELDAALRPRAPQLAPAGRAGPALTGVWAGPHPCVGLLPLSAASAPLPGPPRQGSTK